MTYARFLSSLVAALFFVGQALAAPSAAIPGPENAAFAAGDFAAAERDYTDALAKTPGDVAALAGLARIRLYQERRPEARDLAQRALDSDAGNILAKKVLATVEARDAAFAASVYQIAMPTAAVTVPFTATDPLPIVPVRIDGEKTVYFLIDTGAPDMVVDEAFAKEIGLKASAGSEGTFAGGLHARVVHSLLPRVEIGAVDVRNVPVSLMPTRGFALKPGVQIDGIVGTGLLQHFLPSLDYVHGALVLRERSQSETFEAAAEHDGSSRVPMWLVGDHFIFARARLNEAPERLFNIDTGLAGGGVQATKAALDEARVAVDETHVRTEQGGGGAVRVMPFRAKATLGATSEPDVEGVFTPDGDQFGLFPFRVAGTLSHGFFRKHILTFDFAAMRIVVK